MSTLPDFTGPGYFAGEAPEGLTTVAGVPVAADVRVYWRDPADPAAADVLVAQAASAADGTWRITNLNPALQYVVRGRKAGFDDVSVVGAVPTRTDVVTATGSFVTNADKTGVDGMVLIEGGLPPYTVTQVQPLPLGLEPVINGHELRIAGTSDDAGRWQSMLRVSASNGPSVDVPLTLYIPWTPAHLAQPAALWLDDESLMEASADKISLWGNRGTLGAGFVQQDPLRRPQLAQGTLNGKRTVRFTAQNREVMYSPTSLSLARNRARMLTFVVAKVSHAGVGIAKVFNASWSNPDASDTSVRAGLLLDSGTLYARQRRADTGAAASVSLGYIQGHWALLSCAHDWASAQISGSCNAAARTVVATGQGLGNSSNKDSTQIELGGNYSAFNQTIDGDIAALVVTYDTSLATQQKLEGWAAHRYGLTDLLPADHPYKAEAP